MSLLNDENTKVSFLQRELLAVCGSVNANFLSLHCFKIVTHIASPTSVPIRQICDPLYMPRIVLNSSSEIDSATISSNRSQQPNNFGSRKELYQQRQLLDEVAHVARMISKMLDT